MPDDREDETTFWREQRAERRVVPPDVDQMRVEAGAVMCPYAPCSAAIDSDCMNRVTGGPLKNLPCHPKRLTVARRAAGKASAA